MSLKIQHCSNNTYKNERAGNKTLMHSKNGSNTCLKDIWALSEMWKQKCAHSLYTNKNVRDKPDRP